MFSKLLHKAAGHVTGPSKTVQSYSLFRADNQEGSEASSGVEHSNAREVRIKNVVELGDVRSASTYVKRDLGFQGKLGPHILLSYGDTLFSDASGSDEFRGMTCNSTAIACDEPTCVLDPVLDHNNYPRSLLQPSSKYGEDPSVYSLGITNVVETTPGEGTKQMLAYLKLV